MASKSGSIPSPEKQTKSSGSQTALGNSRRPSPIQTKKMSKSELVASKQDSVAITEDMSLDSFMKKVDSGLSLCDSKEFQNHVGSEVSQIGEQEKKASEHGTNSTLAKSGDGVTSFVKTSGGAKVGDCPYYIESGKSSMCRGSTSSDLSDESMCSSLSISINKPHKANDIMWEAIQAVRAKDGALGLNHFRLLKRLGCGDIGSVYLSELSGTRCNFAMKVMDKASLASRKKLLRAQSEREILQCLDHPFLPTFYTHFETDKFSCLVMEFCPGGDLHTLRQRQPGKHFTEQAVKFYVAEVLLALEYLHLLGVVYRDLKPENVLFEKMDT